VDGIRFSARRRRSIGPVSRHRAVLLLALGLLMLAICSTAIAAPNGTNGSKANSYSIGFTSGLTGQFGAVGQGVRNGITAYFADVNNHGGVNGHPIDFTALDDALDPNRGVANYIQLVNQDHVSAVLGFHSSVGADAVAPLAAQYKVPMIAATVDQGLVKPVQPFVYATTLQTADYAGSEVAMAKKLMAKHKGKIKVATITSSNSTALQQWSDAVANKVKALKWKLVASVIAPQNAVDASTGISQIIAAKPDVLIMALGNDPWLISAMNQIERANAKFPVVEYDAPAWTTLETLHNPKLYYVSAISFSNHSLTPTFYRDAVAQQIDPNAIYVNRGFLQGMIVVAALKKCGYPCSGAQLQAQLDKVSVSTNGMLSGNLTYSPTNHEGVHLMAAYQWKPGKPIPTKVAKNLKAGS
jgi:branched-chain amino acid transport system substrate-binding protein